MPSLRAETKRRTAMAVIPAIALLTAACVHQGAPKVGVNNLKASLVFGVKPPPEPITPGIDFNPADFKVAELTPFVPTAFNPLPPISTTKPVDEGPCPKAPNTAAARDVVDVNITGPAVEGFYKWHTTGQTSVPAADGTPIVTVIDLFEGRLVRNYTVLTPSADATKPPELFSFETVQRKLDNPSHFLVSTFKVNTNPVYRETSPGGSTVVTGPRVGEPERGVVLTSLEELDGKGQRIGQFSPDTGLLLLPLPVQTGEHFESAAVDPKTGQTMVFDATADTDGVLRRQRIDACGKLIDGWLVSGNLTMSSSPADMIDTTLNSSDLPKAYVGNRFDTIIATQFGGVPILEHIKRDPDQVTGSNQTIELTSSRGQLDPDPLPPGAD